MVRIFLSLALFFTVIHHNEAQTTVNCKITLFGMKNNETICHQLVLIRGRVECPTLQSPYPDDVDPIKGRFITVKTFNGSRQSWPINSFNEFKVLTRLKTGNNLIFLSYNYVKTNTETASLNLNLFYQENMSLEPLILGIFVVKDSKLRFDMDRESLAAGEKNDYESAEKRLRMAGLLWQALTSDSLNSYGLGRKSFRLEMDTNQSLFLYFILYSYLVIFYKINVFLDPIIRQFVSNYTKAELEKIFLEQKNFEFMGSVHTAIKESSFYKQQFQSVRDRMLVGCLLLDSYYNKTLNRILLHEALGGGGLGIFGSHLTHGWPENENEFIRRFTDSRSLDFTQLANDDSLTKYRALDVGIGAMLHEVGHIHGLGIFSYPFLRIYY